MFSTRVDFCQTSAEVREEMIAISSFTAWWLLCNYTRPSLILSQREEKMQQIFSLGVLMIGDRFYSHK